MGFRFNKRFKVAPGVHVNFSAKRGISASVGVKGASFNVGADGRKRTTVSAPGTGLSYVTEHRSRPSGTRSGRLLVVLLVVAIIVGLLLVR